MDAHHPRRVTGAARLIVVLALSGFCLPLLAGGALALGPVLPLPSLPLPTLPLPSLPLPSLPLPSLPLPTVPLPSLPLPTLPIPTLPFPSSAATPEPSPSPAAPSPSTSPVAPLATGGTGTGPTTPQPPAGTGDNVSNPSPFSFLLPGLLAGIPALLILIIVLLQIAGGVAWVPFVKRWLGGTGVQTPPQRRGP